MTSIVVELGLVWAASLAHFYGNLAQHVYIGGYIYIHTKTGSYAHK